MNINKAYYIKLGTGNEWADESVKTGKIRFGWPKIQIDLLNSNNWIEVESLIIKDFDDRNKKTGAKNDFNALKNICCVDSNTAFITFYSHKMYWCFPKSNKIFEDDISKYIEVKDGWSDSDINKKRIFDINQISGRITKYQMFLGTLCSVNNKLEEFNYLKSLIFDKEPIDRINILNAKTSLEKALIPAIKNLIPKDFEILVDLIFRNSGWRRTSVLGEVMKHFDIILEDPFSKRNCCIQIKSKSNLKTYQEYKKIFLFEYKESFNTFYYFVHTCNDKNLENYKEIEENIQLMKIDEISKFVIDTGLVNWVLDHS